MTEQRNLVRVLCVLFLTCEWDCFFFVCAGKNRYTVYCFRIRDKMHMVQIIREKKIRKRLEFKLICEHFSAIWICIRAKCECLNHPFIFWWRWTFFPCKFSFLINMFQFFVQRSSGFTLTHTHTHAFGLPIFIFFITSPFLLSHFQGKQISTTGKNLIDLWRFTKKSGRTII